MSPPHASALSSPGLRSAPAAESGPPLLDGFGRVARDLRLSVTDVCNLRCRYCLPGERVAWLPRDERLTDDETVRLVGLLAGLGVRTVRVTGGEPLVRPGLAALVRRIRGISGVAEIREQLN